MKNLSFGGLYFSLEEQTVMDIKSARIIRQVLKALGKLVRSIVWVNF